MMRPMTRSTRCRPRRAQHQRRHPLDGARAHLHPLRHLGIGDEIEALQSKGHALNEIAILVRASFQMREFEDRFVRVHRAAVVAVAAIDSLKKDEDGRTRVILRSGDAADDLVVSRRHVADVKRRLKKG